MNLLRTLAYFFREGATALARHKTLHGFAVFMVALSLFILGFSRYLTGNVNALMASWSSRLEVRVFLEDGLPEDRIAELKALFEKNPIVSSVELVTPEQALGILAKIAPAFGDASSVMGTNPLPSSLALHVKPPLDQEGIRTLVTSAEKEKGVSQVLFDWEWVNKLRTYSRFVSLVGWLLFVALGTAAVFTVTAVTRILALSRREEIAILHFVGATASSIRGPFVAGGFLVGMLSGLLALAGLGVTHFALRQLAGDHALLLNWLSSAFLAPSDQIGLLLLGMVLGAVGGGLSLGSSERWG